MVTAERCPGGYPLCQPLLLGGGGGLSEAVTIGQCSVEARALGTALRQSQPQRRKLNLRPAYISAPFRRTCHRVPPSMPLPRHLRQGNLTLRGLTLNQHRKWPQSLSPRQSSCCRPVGVPQAPSTHRSQASTALSTRPRAPRCPRPSRLIHSAAPPQHHPSRLPQHGGNCPNYHSAPATPFPPSSRLCPTAPSPPDARLRRPFKPSPASSRPGPTPRQPHPKTCPATRPQSSPCQQPQTALPLVCVRPQRP